MSDTRVTVVIPAKDEEGLIGEIVDSVRPYADEVLVVDGHSRDRTRDIAVEHGARVIQDNGRGKGEALRLSISAATTGIVVFIDADGSHDPHGHSRARRADQGRTRPTWSSARAARAAATSFTARSSSSSATSDRS